MILTPTPIPPRFNKRQVFRALGDPIFLSEESMQQMFSFYTHGMIELRHRQADKNSA